MKCHYIYDEEVGKVLIPGCWGTVIHGIENCECRNMYDSFGKYEKALYNEAIGRQNKIIKELESENARLNRLVKNLLMKGIVITDHAYERAKERCGWKEAVTDKMAKLAYEKGVNHEAAKGNLKGYIERLFMQYKTANNIKIYGEDVFLFSKNCLITIYHLPPDLKKLAVVSKRSK